MIFSVNLFCSMRISYYICTVFSITQRTNILKIAQKAEVKPNKTANYGNSKKTN